MCTVVDIICGCVSPQLSMERDKLRTNLNRTTEEKEKLVQEGDEHLERITKMSEKKAMYECLLFPLLLPSLSSSTCFSYIPY